MIYLLNFDNKSCVTTLYLQTRSTSEVKTLLQTGQNAFCSRQRKLACGGIDWKPPTSHSRVFYLRFYLSCISEEKNEKIVSQIGAQTGKL